MLLLAALRLLPAFLTLFDLFTRVIAVFETMVTVLIFQQIKLFKFWIERFLANLLLVVKTLIVFLLTQDNAYAEHSHHFMAIGQHKTIQTSEITRFSIGNKGVIQAHLEDSQGPITIKAHGLGQSELLLWGADNKQVSFTFNIITKKQYQKFELLKSLISSDGLKINSSKGVIKISGPVEKIDVLNNLKDLEDLNFNIPYRYDLKISKRSRNNHIGIIYQQFWSHGIKKVRCELKTSLYHCYVSRQEPIKKDLTNYFESNWPVKLHHIGPLNPTTYCASIELFKTTKPQIAFQLDNDFVPGKLEFKHSRVSSDVKESLGKTFLKLTHGEKVNFKTGEKSIIHSTGRRHKPITLFTGISSTIKVEHQSQRPVIQMKTIISGDRNANGHNESVYESSFPIDFGKETIFFSHYGESFLGKKKSLFSNHWGKYLLFFLTKKEGNKVFIYGSIKLSEDCDA